MRKSRALRQFTLSTGKSAGRNSGRRKSLFFSILVVGENIYIIFSDLGRLILYLLFYYFYINTLFSLFHVVPFYLDFFVHFDGIEFLRALSSQPIDFGLICSFDNVGDSSSLPTLESESITESIGTYRNGAAAESEALVYDRIRDLENQHFYNIPPQNNEGEYENLVRSHFDMALDVHHYLEIWDREYKELQFLEQKGEIQNRLHELMLSEQSFERIMELSPYSDVRKEAYHFLQDKLEPVSSLEHSFQRDLMEGCLGSFVRQLNEGGRESDFYGEFYRHFTDENFRRELGP
jgi:hypothetical protein